MFKKFRALVPFITRQWRLLATVAVLTACSSAVAALQPWPLKLLVDSVFDGGRLPAWLAGPLGRSANHSQPYFAVLCAAGAAISVYVLSAAVTTALNWFWTLLGQRMVYDLSTALFYRLQRISLTYHHRNSPGDSLSRLSGDAWCIYELTGHFFSPGEQVFTLATVGVVAWRLNPELAMVSVIASPVLAASTIYFGQLLKARAKKTREAESRLASFIHQTLSSMPVVQAFASEERNSRNFASLAADAVALTQRRSMVASAYGFANGFITTLGAALVTYFGARQVMAGRLSVGSLIIFIAYIRTMQNAAEALLKMYGELKPVEASIDRVLEVIQPRPDEPCDLPGVRPLPPCTSAPRIAFDDVSFGYEPGRPVLEDISFVAEPGQMIAIVGETGAGKSSLASLIPRFYDPWNGRVLMNGEDLRRVEISGLRRQIGFVLQEPFLFSATIADNIGYARPQSTRKQIIRAAELAQADDFISRLPNGYDTVLGEYGATLSGGEQQRIAIARALLKDAPVLILDEPTSALDARTEAALIEALDTLVRGRTCFVIAHRLSTIRSADSVLVLSKGRIIEHGTHRELLESTGVFHRLHSLQWPAALHGVSA